VSVRLSVSLSRKSTAAAADSGFAVEVVRGQHISIDSCCYRATCGPRKFWPDCEEVQHTCLSSFYVDHTFCDKDDLFKKKSTCVELSHFSTAVYECSFYFGHITQIAHEMSLVRHIQINVGKSVDENLLPAHIQYHKNMSE